MLIEKGIEVFNTKTLEKELESVMGLDSGIAVFKSDNLALSPILIKWDEETEHFIFLDGVNIFTVSYGYAVDMLMDENFRLKRVLNILHDLEISF